MQIRSLLTDCRRILHLTLPPIRPQNALSALRDAIPWDSQRYLLRDRDRIFGEDFTKQVEDIGIKDVLSTLRAPWQRAYVE